MDEKTQNKKQSDRRKQLIGRWGEEQAQSFLEERGFLAIGRNIRTPYGEIDLVVKRGDMVVFVEVKARTGREFGLPEAAVTPQKRVHLVQSAEAYIQQHPEIEGDWRIDVIAIQGRPGQTEGIEIEWFENAIS